MSAVAASSVVSFAMPGIAAAAGLLNLGRAVADLPLIYFDRFVPWIKYKLEDGAAAGTKDLIIGNVLDSFLRLLGAGSVGAQGNMRVTDYKRGAGVIFSERGDLGLAFEDISITGILAALAPRVAGVPIAQSVFAALSAQAMGYAAIYLAQQFKGFAKDNGWLADGDPLVIDLDGDGIETTGLGSAVRRMAANDNERGIWARRAYCTRLTA